MTETQHEAYMDYINGMKYKDIAKKYHVSINTVRSWKTRNNWKRIKHIQASPKPIKDAHTKVQNDVHTKTSEEMIADGSISIQLRNFADYYLVSGDAVDSAVKAGYSSSYSKHANTRLLQQPAVQDYISVRMRPIEDSSIMSVQEILQRLTQIARGEAKETVFVSTADGYYREAKEADLKTRIAAMKEIAKRYPSADRVIEARVRNLSAEANIKEIKAKEINPNSVIDHNKQFEKLSDDDLRRLAHNDPKFNDAQNMGK